MQYEDDPRSNRDPAQAKAMLERKALLYDKIKCVWWRAIVWRKVADALLQEGQDGRLERGPDRQSARGL